MSVKVFSDGVVEMKNGDEVYNGTEANLLAYCKGRGAKILRDPEPVAAPAECKQGAVTRGTTSSDEKPREPASYSLSGGELVEPETVIPTGQVSICEVDSQSTHGSAAPVTRQGAGEPFTGRNARLWETVKDGISPAQRKVVYREMARNNVVSMLIASSRTGDTSYKKKIKDVLRKEKHFGYDPEPIDHGGRVVGSLEDFLKKIQDNPDEYFTKVIEPPLESPFEKRVREAADDDLNRILTETD